MYMYSAGSAMNATNTILPGTLVLPTLISHNIPCHYLLIEAQEQLYEKQTKIAYIEGKQLFSFTLKPINDG